MPLTAGIVGLPNVGKSTLFNAITRSQVEAANYPFATIQPNVGVVEVKDERLKEIARIFTSKKTIYTTFEFRDIAGLVKGASQGEGLGNQFLSHIRDVDAIVHVVRCFDDHTITHVEESVDPVRDIEIINLELILSDQQSIENRISKVERKAKQKDKDAMIEFALLQKINDQLNAGKSVRNLDLNKDEELLIKSFNLLTQKPVIYVANMAENEVLNAEKNNYYQLVSKIAQDEDAVILPICAKIEEELAGLDDEERDLFLNDLGYHESGLDQIIKSTYSLLSLWSYFTAGPQEARAWTFIKGMKAPECAGIIHTDFQKGFIKAECYAYDDLIQHQSEQAVKDMGKFRIEGKEYLVKDGDILHFRFNV